MTVTTIVTAKISDAMRVSVEGALPHTSCAARKMAVATEKRPT